MFALCHAVEFSCVKYECHSIAAFVNTHDVDWSARSLQLVIVWLRVLRTTRIRYVYRVRLFATQLYSILSL